jgi:hypothetical protein
MEWGRGQKIRIPGQIIYKIYLTIDIYDSIIRKSSTLHSYTEKKVLPESAAFISHCGPWITPWVIYHCTH